MRNALTSISLRISSCRRAATERGAKRAQIKMVVDTLQANPFAIHGYAIVGVETDVADANRV